MITDPSEGFLSLASCDIESAVPLAFGLRVDIVTQTLIGGRAFVSFGVFGQAVIVRIVAKVESSADVHNSVVVRHELASVVSGRNITIHLGTDLFLTTAISRSLELPLVLHLTESISLLGSMEERLDFEHGSCEADESEGDEQDSNQEHARGMAHDG